MWFRLARQFGTPVWYLQRIMPSSEFQEWAAYEAISPGMPERLDLNAASVVSAIINVNRDARKTKAVTIEDARLKFKYVTQKHTGKDLKIKFLQWMSMYNRQQE